MRWECLLDNGDVDWRSGAGAVDLGIGHYEAGYTGVEEGLEMLKQRLE